MAYFIFLLQKGLPSSDPCYLLCLEVRLLLGCAAVLALPKSSRQRVDHHVLLDKMSLALCPHRAPKSSRGHGTGRCFTKLLWFLPFYLLFFSWDSIGLFSCGSIFCPLDMLIIILLKILFFPESSMLVRPLKAHCLCRLPEQHRHCRIWRKLR